MERLRKGIFPFIIALSALSVSLSAAFYSVSGLGKLFAGASTEVMVMAASLEVSKLVIASLLYQYWDSLNKVLRTYLTIATVVLILITSMGIYGFLSGAYQATANRSNTVDAQIALLETKKANYIQQRDLLTKEKESLVQGISSLQSGLANNKTSYVDKKGNVIQSSSAADRKVLDKQLSNSSARQDALNTKLDEVNDQIFDLDNQIVEAKTGSGVATELGPLKYISGLTGIPMDRVVNYLLLVIIFVFDPLAISLVIAANFAFAQIKPKENLYGEKVYDDDIKVWDVTLTDGLDEEEPQEKPVEQPKEEPVLLKEEVKEEDWKIVDEQGKEITEEQQVRIVKILQKTPSRNRVLLSNGREAWVHKHNSEDENGIRYL
jgi:cell division protein FtsB